MTGKKVLKIVGLVLLLFIVLGLIMPAIAHLRGRGVPPDPAPASANK